MSILTWDYFHEEVIPRAPGAPVGIVNKAIRDACIEFCERTKFHQRTLGPLVLAAQDPSVELITLPEQTEIVDVRYAYLFDGQELEPAGEDMLVRELGPAWETRKGTPRYYHIENESAIRLIPYPEEVMDNALTLRVSLRPTADSTGIEAFIARRYKFALGRGALAYLMSAPESYSYSNHGLAATHRATFESQMGTAAVRKYRGGTRQRTRTRASFF